MSPHIPSEPIGFRLCHELEGLLTGISADGRIEKTEVDRVVRWLSEVQRYRSVQPFAEIIPHLERALADGALTVDEVSDLLFVVQKFTTVNPYFDAIRAGVQVLMGILAGIAADQTVPEMELRRLQTWLDEWEHLRGMWPYDECEAAAVSALNQSVDPNVTNYLIALAAQFPVAGATQPGDEPAPLLIKGVCAIDPDIQFEGRRFVFTGESARAERKDLETRVHIRNGLTHSNVTRETNYLVVCDQSSALWAFSCYGRKVEKAHIPSRRTRLQVLRVLRDRLHNGATGLIVSQYRNSAFEVSVASPRAQRYADGWILSGQRGAFFYAPLPPDRIQAMSRAVGLSVADVQLYEGSALVTVCLD